MEPVVSTPEERRQEKGGGVKKPVHHSAATPIYTTPADLIDDVRGPFPEVPAGEAVMAVEADAEVAAVTRSIVFVASEV